MKIWKIASVLVFAAGCATTQEAPQEPPKEVAAPVQAAKTIKEKQITAYLTAGTKIYYADKTLSGRIETTYDNAGRLKKEDVFSAAGNLTETKTGTFSGGKLTITQANGLGEVQAIRIQNLGPRGRIDAEEVYNSKKEIQSTQTYVYDEMDRVVEWKNKDASGGLLATTSYQYSGDQLVKITALDGAGTLISRFDHVYDTNSLLKEKTEVRGDGSMAGKVIYKYDPQGRVVREEFRSGANAILRVVEYSYDAQNNAILTTLKDKRDNPIELREKTFVSFTKTILVKE